MDNRLKRKIYQTAHLRTPNMRCECESLTVAPCVCVCVCVSVPSLRLGVSDYKSMIVLTGVCAF